MSNFDKQFEQALEYGIESGAKAAGKFFQRVWEGIKNLRLPENRRSFLISLAIILILAGVAEFLGARELKKEFLVVLLYKQKLIPWPIGFLVLLGGVLFRLYLLGQDLISEKLQIAFERAGLYSQRKVFDTEANKPTHEYPRIVQTRRLLDGGLLIILRNPGLALETWKKAMPAFEATFEKRCSRIDFQDKNPGIIELKIGGNELVEKLSYTTELVVGGTKAQVVLGVNKDNQRIIHDFKSVPHLLIAGITGSGKSVELRCVAYQALEQLGANLWAVDFKGGIEFGPFEASGVEVVWERERTLEVTNFLIEEHHRRIEVFKHYGVKNIDEYNKRFPEKALKRCFLAVDELAELTDPTGAPADELELFQQIEGALSTIARLTRASGIHLLLATQRPEAKVITGQIKTNIGGRVCGYLPDIPASQLVVNSPMATKLDNIGGRFLYTTGNKVIEFQAPFFEDKHINKDVKVDYAKGMLTDYHSFISESPATPSVKVRRMRQKRV